MVELTFRYLRPIRYEQQCRIDIIYTATAAAKIIFDYEIHDALTDELLATGHSVQAFMDKDYQLQWYKPTFYAEWQERWNLNSEENHD